MRRRAFLTGSSAAVAAVGLPRPALSEVVPPSERDEYVCGLYRKDNFPRKVGLTFDDGPNKEATAEILAILKQHSVPATFFIEGRRARRYPDQLKAIRDAGHEMGNHTDTHPILTDLSAKVIARQFARCQDTVDEILGEHRPLVFHRPPGGAPWVGGGRSARRKVAHVIRDRGGALAMWHIGLRDWNRRLKTQSAMDRLFEQFERGDGGLTVWHPGSGVASRVLPELIPRLKDEGYAIVGIEELMRDKYGVSVTEALALPSN